MHAARAVVRRVESGAGNSFVTVHQVFAFAERIKEDCHRANIECVSADPHQVVQNSRDLVKHHPNILGALGRSNAEQILDRQHIAVLVTHHRHVVETIHITDALVIGLALCKFFSTTMKQPDMRVRTLNSFAVELQNQPQHAMSRRVLWAEVHCVITYLCHRTRLL